MAKKNIFEQHQSGGTATFLITSDTIIDLITDLIDASGDTQTVSITKLHWTNEGTTSVTVTETENNIVTETETSTPSNIRISATAESAPNIDFRLGGNGVWSQFNGWTPVTVNGNITVDITGNASLFIELKKLAGYDRRNDYSAAAE